MATAFEWNVVVAGAWNRAILTPSGIAKRLFATEPNTALQVEIPLDGIGPFRVRINSLLVSVGNGRLVLEAQTPDYETLGSAMAAGARALAALGETPVSAAGINVRYRFETTPFRLAELTRTELDTELTKLDLPVRGRETRRQVPFKSGSLNVLITEADAGEGTLVLNFNLDSTDPRLLEAWLQCPTPDLEVIATKVCNALGLDLTESTQ